MLLFLVLRTACVLLLTQESALLGAKQTGGPNTTTSELTYSVYICQDLLCSSCQFRYSTLELTTVQ